MAIVFPKTGKTTLDKVRCGIPARPVNPTRDAVHNQATDLSLGRGPKNSLPWSLEVIVHAGALRRPLTV
jgi:hypothetical protein